MSEHYPRSTESTLALCARCGKITRHKVSDGRLAECLEHEAPYLTKKQARDRAKREKTTNQQNQQPELFSGPKTGK